MGKQGRRFNLQRFLSGSNSIGRTVKKLKKEREALTGHIILYMSRNKTIVL
jgi:hypothetical protein